MGNWKQGQGVPHPFKRPDDYLGVCYLPLSEKWNDDDFYPTKKKEIHVFEWDGERFWNPLPLTINLDRGSFTAKKGKGYVFESDPVAMDRVRKSVEVLTEEGGECWPGEIKPLKEGGFYLVAMSDRYEYDNFECLCMISR